MGKTKTLKTVISKEHLEKLTTKQGALNEIITRIGMIETEKHSLLHRIGDVNKAVEEFKVELEEEYGQVTIDLSTGEYEPIKTEVEDAVEDQED